MPLSPLFYLCYCNLNCSLNFNRLLLDVILFLFFVFFLINVTIKDFRFILIFFWKFYNYIFEIDPNRILVCSRTRINSYVFKRKECFINLWKFEWLWGCISSHSLFGNIIFWFHTFLSLLHIYFPLLTVLFNFYAVNLRLISSHTIPLAAFYFVVIGLKFMFSILISGAWWIHRGFVVIQTIELDSKGRM